MPLLTTPSSASVTRLATVGVSAWLPARDSRCSSRPPAVTRSNSWGRWWTPRAASVANALVISNGETPSG
ncbi:MAG TPA: hypothetical protein VK631_16095, partial [Solirubrobacteraceae bacterium]|nr:hypothetical protein [Solirubrobacteraceae bacterium]